jgi:hypothetical protein
MLNAMLGIWIRIPLGPGRRQKLSIKGKKWEILREIDDFSAGLEASFDLGSPLRRPKNNYF